MVAAPAPGRRTKDTGMAEELLRYDLMVEDALRGVVRAALQQVVEQGLPGEHHFYITFRTDSPDATVPERLRARYPEEMTIVLQHRFWDLKVEEDHFEVTLTFGDIAESLVIPFAALTGFADPSVRFGLQFGSLSMLQGEEEEAEEADSQPEEPALPAEGEAEKVVTLDRFRKKP